MRVSKVYCQLGPAIALSVVAGCYAPTPQVGLPCTSRADCPAGQECQPDLTCQLPGGNSIDGGPIVDAPDAATFCQTPLTFAAVNFGDCLPIEVGPALIWSGAITIDTAAGTITINNAEASFGAVVAQNSGDETLLIATPSLTIEGGATVTVVGSRPLVIASLGDVTIDGIFSVDGSGKAPGPGGDPAQCDSRPNGGQQIYLDEFGGVGGGGGGFGTAGGAGAGVQASPDFAPNPGGVASGDAALTPLRGGCSGGDGGALEHSVAEPLNGGAGGQSGGALQIIAEGNFTLGAGASISAAGAGGHAPSYIVGAMLPGGIAMPVGAGGGGGGGGGSIVLESANLSIDGAVTANGGGGGAGGMFPTYAITNGANGSRDTTVPAPGGTRDPSDNFSSVGGNGGALDSPPTDSVVGASFTLFENVWPSGGGGGGGAAGRIRLITRGTLTVTGVVSPTASN